MWPINFAMYSVNCTFHPIWQQGATSNTEPKEKKKKKKERNQTMRSVDVGGKKKNYTPGSGLQTAINITEAHLISSRCQLFIILN